MDKSRDTDEFEMLSLRFQDLIDKVHRIMGELGEMPEPRGSLRQERAADGAAHITRAYTIQAGNGGDTVRSRALMQIVEGAMKDLDRAMGPIESYPLDPKPISDLPKKKRASLFTMEELHFLEKTFMACHGDKNQKNIPS